MDAGKCAQCLLIVSNRETAQKNQYN